MTRPLSRTLLAVALAAAAAPLPASAQDRDEGVAVTVYSAPRADPNQVQQVFNPRTGAWELPVPGFSVVKERRRVDLQPGRNTLRHEGVASGIDGSTVLFRSLTDPEGTRVLEQSYAYDLADANRILDKYLGREVTVRMVDGTAQGGRLLSFDNAQLVVQGADGLRILRRGEAVRGIETGALPDGFVTKPTLVWLVEAAKAGTQLVETAYETSGMSWNADYAAVVNADETKVDLSAWVTIRNESGASYEGAAVKLVAGDLNRVPKQGNERMYAVAAMEKSLSEGDGRGFTEKSFFEYHLYTLGRRTSLPERSLKQIELFDPVAGVPCRKVYLYDGTRGMQPWWGNGPNMDENFGETGNRKVGVYLEIENRKENGLGIPLPAGRMRVHKRDDADGFPELVGEDAVDHTPKDERVRLRMGDAFDIVGERRRTAFKADYDHHRMEESFEIRVRNHKTEAVEVLVAERLFRWVNAEVVKKSVDFVGKDAQTIHFPVKVPADGEAVVTYTVVYTW